MDNPYPAEAWKRLGKALEQRRGQLGYGHRQRDRFARERHSGLSLKTLARLERGERADYPDATLGAAEVLYGWQPGSIKSVLNGGEPVPVQERDFTDEEIVRAFIALLERRGLRTNGDEERRGA